MKRFRPVVHAILGLLLLVQGFAVASASSKVAAAGDNASAAAAMPCHGEHHGDQGGGSKHMSCCDADCPDMMSCALGAMAMASAQTFEIVAPQQAMFPALVAAPATLPPPSFLRPPIASHA